MIEYLNQLPLLIRNPSMQEPEQILDFDHFNLIFNEEIENPNNFHIQQESDQQEPFINWVLDQQLQEEENPFLNLDPNILQDPQHLPIYIPAFRPVEIHFQPPFLQQDFQDQQFGLFQLFQQQDEYEQIFQGFQAFLCQQIDQQALNIIFPFVYHLQFFPGCDQELQEIARRENLQKHRELQIKRRQEQLQKQEQEAIRILFLETPFQGIDLQMKECPICATYDNDLYTLGCKDEYCRSCAKLLLKDLVDNSKVFPQQLVCPICEMSVADQIFLEIAGPVQFRRLQDLRESLRVDHLVNSGKAIYCPVPQCKGYVHIVNGKISIACAVCRVTICPECKKCTHPNLTCEEYSQSLRGDDQDLEEMMISRQWKRCPFCASIVEKLDGCQFVRCRSKVCGGSQYRCICYLCGKGLNEKHHFSHYQINGPFGNTCNTLDGIQDTPTEEDPRFVQQRQEEQVGEQVEEQEEEQEEEQDFGMALFADDDQFN